MKSKEFAESATMTMIQIHRPNAMVASTAAGCLIYSGKGRIRENRFKNVEVRNIAQ